ncbi:MAG: KH domain-containing protein [Candidatus Heimdallarchaeaceae archaeon]
MSGEFLVRLPLERIAVLIGPKGSTKKHIEDLTGCILKIDSNNGDVVILAEEEIDDPINLWKARDIVKAIGRGFSPQRAYTIMQPNYIFEIISLREIVGTSPNALRNVRSRVIGRKGSTRNFIEQATRTYISVYHNTVGIIGELRYVEIARTAVIRLIHGAKHSTVYNFIERQMRELSEKKAAIWSSQSMGDYAQITDLDELERIIFEEEKKKKEKVANGDKG